MTDELLPAWACEYVGIPFAEKGRTREGADCWGLARLVLEQQFRLPCLPDYVGAYTASTDRASVAEAISVGLLDGWELTCKPVAGCLVILRLAGKPWHCGVMVNSRWMLHTLHGLASAAERIQSITWANRIEGFYRRAA